MSELQGMVVVVNGGTHGLGEATVRSAAAKGARSGASERICAKF